LTFSHDKPYYTKKASSPKLVATDFRKGLFPEGTSTIIALLDMKRLFICSNREMGEFLEYVSEEEDDSSDVKVINSDDEDDAESR
jgi:hypothetical protein